MNALPARTRVRSSSDFADTKAVQVVGRTRSGSEKTVRVAGQDLKKYVVRRARKGCLLPGKIVPSAVKS